LTRRWTLPIGLDLASSRAAVAANAVSIIALFTQRWLDNSVTAVGTRIGYYVADPAVCLAFGISTTGRGRTASKIEDVPRGAIASAALIVVRHTASSGETRLRGGGAAGKPQDSADS
jgi:hypothetical protein